MTLVHNVLLRSLNAIVLQAPHITGADIAPFTRFILAWHTMISIHHAGEEALFFPAVERMSGVVGVMDKEKGEHEQFHAGLHALKGYVDAVGKEEEEWDGGKVVAVVEGFGGVLRGHLKGEVESLEGLRRFGEEKMKGVMKAAEEEAEAGMVSSFLLSFSQVKMLTYMDRNHSGGSAWRGRFSRSTASLRRAHGSPGRQHLSRSSSSPRRSWGGFMPMGSSIRRVIGMGGCSRCTRSGTSSETVPGLRAQRVARRRRPRRAAGGKAGPDFGFMTGVRIHKC
jgi:hemerythrin-like domain-containing protein